jgi:IS605 OrfB family transposase
VKKTIRVPIQPERPNDILNMMIQYGKIYSKYVEWALGNNTYSKQKAHEQLYTDLRTSYPDIPSALIQASRDNALESIKVTKFKRKPKPKKYATVRYDKRTCTLRGQQLTLSSIGKRQKFILDIPDYFKEIFESWRFTGCQLSYTNRNFWICLNYETESPEKQDGDALGLDRGIINIVATSKGDKYSGKEVRKHRRKHLHNRKTCQAKGTRSAKRRLKKMSGREKRFSKDVNHVVSKWICSMPETTFVLEDLSRNRKKKGKKFNKRISDWSFYQLEQFLKYKSEACGKKVVYVDARYTSQKCSCCGSIDKKSRNGGNYVCVRCGYSEHSDLNAAKNIRDNYLLSTHVSGTGCSQSPVCSPTS